ncbi:MAG TPA: flagellar hook-associated protein 3 [Deltaproteobacteria bacterium]|nr:flagellar hook-associated protein 3 [Deltaproteobacteria bacterium]
MRISSTSAYNTMIADILERQEAVFEANQRLSTGRRVNRPSDDPVNTPEILNSRSVIASLDQYERNIQSGLTYLSRAEKTLDSVKSVLTRIEEIAVSQATGTVDAASRQNAATEVQQLLADLIGYGNTTDADGDYIFSGYLTDTPAFDSSGTYQGDSNKYSISFGFNKTMTVGVNGNEVFKGGSSGTDIFTAVSDLAAALNSDDTAGIQSALADIQSGYDQVSNAVADIGGRVSRLENALSDIDVYRVELRSSVSDIEDADMAEVISEISLNQYALEAAMRAASRLLEVNFFNLL